MGATPVRLVVMGVAGSGKSTLAKLLAVRLGWPFQEGDDLHPPANIARMASGLSLTEADRVPWLNAVANWIAERRAAGESGAVSCSALRRAHRERLRQADPSLRFILLHPDRIELERRLRERRGHYFKAELLDDQLKTFEPPQPDEDVLAPGPTLSPAEAAEEVER